MGKVMIGDKYNSSKGIFCSKESEVPTVMHFAIIVFSSVHIPGDERSRTNPGHGYPAHDEPTLSYEAFMDEYAWIEAIEKHTKNNTKFRAMKVHPVAVTTEVRVLVK